MRISNLPRWWIVWFWISVVCIMITSIVGSQDGWIWSSWSVFVSRLPTLSLSASLIALTRVDFDGR